MNNNEFEYSEKQNVVLESLREFYRLLYLFLQLRQWLLYSM